MLGGLAAQSGSLYCTAQVPQENRGSDCPAYNTISRNLCLLPRSLCRDIPDWMAMTEDAVWVTSSSANHVVRLDSRTNQPGAIVTAAKPCSGLVVDFGSLWIPSCGDHSLLRVDAVTGTLQATIAAAPADSEGGICSGAGSIWIVVSKESDLVRIDPSTNKVSATIRIPKGSFNPVFAQGFVWVSSNTGGTLVRVRPSHQLRYRRNPCRPGSAVPDGGRRLDLGFEPGRRNHRSGGCGIGQTNCADCRRNPRPGGRDRLWRRGGMGHSIRFSYHPN